MVDSPLAAVGIALTLIAVGALAVAAGPAAQETARSPALETEDDPIDGLPDAAAWLEAARTGEPLTLVIEGRGMQVDVEEDRTFLAHRPPILDATGDTVAVDHLVFLKGEVLGASGSVRATIDGDRVWATFLGSPIGPFYLVPSDDGPQAITDVTFARLRDVGYGGQIHQGHGAADTTPRLGSKHAHDVHDEDEDSPDCLRAVPKTGDPLGLVVRWPERTFDVAYAVDEHMTELHDDWSTQVLHFIQDVDAIYQDAIDLAVSPVHIIVIPDADLPSTTTSGNLRELKAYYDTHHADLDREAVYLFKAADFTNAGGQVSCIGGAGYTNDGYGVGGTEWAGPYSFTGLDTLLPDKPVKIAAHELGHLLAAHHHHANCVETAPRYDPLVTLDVCTILINDWGLIQPTFSTLNRLVMRAHADEVGL